MFCFQCGNQNSDAAVFCVNCGTCLKLNTNLQHQKSEEEPLRTKNKFVSSQEIPDGIKGWSWGAFLLNWIWAIGNRTWWGILAVIPCLGFLIAFWLGYKGREMAWKNRSWDNVDHFNRVQKKWSQLGCVLILGLGLIGILAAVAIPAYQDYVKKAQAKNQSSEVFRESSPTSRHTFDPDIPYQVGRNSRLDTNKSKPDISKEKLAVAADSVRLALSKANANVAHPKLQINDRNERIKYIHWLGEMTTRLKIKIPDEQSRREFLEETWYEATRHGLNPSMVLGLIEVESDFQKDAESNIGARGYMGIMPYWTEEIGDGDNEKLFHMQSNLRYGCVILRMYIDIEGGNLFLGLGRYKSKVGEEYPNAVLAAWRRYENK